MPIVLTFVCNAKIIIIQENVISFIKKICKCVHNGNRVHNGHWQSVVNSWQWPLLLLIISLTEFTTPICFSKFRYVHNGHQWYGFIMGTGSDHNAPYSLTSFYKFRYVHNRVHNDYQRFVFIATIQLTTVTLITVSFNHGHLDTGIDNGHRVCKSHHKLLLVMKGFINPTANQDGPDEQK